MLGMSVAAIKVIFVDVGRRGAAVEKAACLCGPQSFSAVRLVKPKRLVVPSPTPGT